MAMLLMTDNMGRCVLVNTLNQTLKSKPVGFCALWQKCTEHILRYQESSLPFLIISAGLFVSEQKPKPSGGGPHLSLTYLSGPGTKQALGKCLMWGGSSLFGPWISHEKRGSCTKPLSLFNSRTSVCRGGVHVVWALWILAQILTQIRTVMGEEKGGGIPEGETYLPGAGGRSLVIRKVTYDGRSAQTAGELPHRVAVGAHVAREGVHSSPVTGAC